MMAKISSNKKAGAIKAILVVLAGICAVIGLLVFGLIAGCVGLFNYGMNMAEEEMKLDLRHDVVLVKHIGEIEEIDMEFMESAKQSSNTDEEVFLLKVVGSKAGGLIKFKTSKSEKNGKIITESIRTLELDTGEIIKLPLAVGIWNAVDSGHIESIEMLLNEGVDVNSEDDQGWSVLDQALASNNKECIDLIKSKGGKSNANKSIFIASGIGDLEAVKIHLESGVDVNLKDDSGWTALHYASDRKNVASLLIQKGAKLNAMNADDDTPLDKAIEWEDSETADLIRKHGGKTWEELNL
ncbi:MAG: hypothetical protein CMO57_00105 [Verrucomicrobiales bacterium]|nr:hypothetical protein [Verrucomicrobiales bacterium]|tara:strand:+ start:3711 stop:4601 length:891 start_codon:yes stop_codon:yes gene_type:complete